MNKDLLKIALIGLAAGFCISAKAVPEKNNQEVAMSKCTKENGNKKKCGSSSSKKNNKCGSSCSKKNNRYDNQDNGKDSGCDSKGRGCQTSALCNGYSTDEFKPGPQEIAAKRKSAAKKVMEGY